MATNWVERGAKRRCMAAGLVVAWATTAACQPAAAALEDAQAWRPEAATAPGLAASEPERLLRRHGHFGRHAVAAAHPLAAEAAATVLRRGGNALDAALAAQWMLSLVEPQSSGLGGGGFLMWWDGQAMQAWDGRETAPLSATPQLFVGPSGQALPFGQAQASGLSVGVPGLVAMLWRAHGLHGRLPWAELFEPAVRVAEAGFSVGPRLHSLLAGAKHLREDPAARAFFYQAQVPGAPPSQAVPWPVGHRLRNPALAAVFRRLAAEGADGLMKGPVAEAIVARVQGHPTRPGTLSLDDLADYLPVQRQPMCQPWRDRAQICGMPPPSSGHLAVMQTLGVLSNLPADQPQGAAPLGNASRRLVDPDWVYRFTEAARLAFADRAVFVADPAFVAAPGWGWAALLDPCYLAQRAALVGPHSLGTAAPGQPPGSVTQAWAAQPDQPEYGTTHLSVVDGTGRAVALTSSIEAAFGNGMLVDGGTGLAGGFLLNNQLTDFAWLPSGSGGQAVANRVQAGKRPRSSMAPTLVLDVAGKRLEMSLGSPGGPAIIHFVARTLWSMLETGASPWEAVQAPNLGSFNGSTWLEAGRWDAAVIADLQARGQRVEQLDLPSGLHVVQRQGSGWRAAADPRREGAVAGD